MSGTEGLLDQELVAGILLFMGLAFIVLEGFVPSGGVIGILALASIVFGIYCLFRQDHPYIAMMVIPMYLLAFYGMFQFMVRRLSFKGAMAPDTSTSVDMRIVDLVGKEGVTTMPLRPAGMAIIDGNKVDVVTMGDFIEKDIPVRVVDNSGNRVVVRQMDSRSSKV